jgi:hypothetical protein
LEIKNRLKAFLDDGLRKTLWDLFIHTQTTPTDPTLKDLSANIRQLTRRAETLNFEPITKMIKNISPDSKMQLIEGLARFMRAMDMAVNDCDDFVRQNLMLSIN